MVQFKSEKFSRMVGAAVLAVSTSLALVACGGNQAATEQPAEQPAEQQAAEQPAADAAASDFDANGFYAGQWRGSVEITGQTVYGNAGGNEQMLDVFFNEDGTCEVKPLEAHADLLADSGTWEGTAESVTLHLGKGDITLNVTGAANLAGNAADFDIADFETINFDFYG